MTLYSATQSTAEVQRTVAVLDGMPMHYRRCEALRRRIWRERSCTGHGQR